MSYTDSMLKERWEQYLRNRPAKKLPYPGLVSYYEKRKADWVKGGGSAQVFDDAFEKIPMSATDSWYDLDGELAALSVLRAPEEEYDLGGILSDEFTKVIEMGRNAGLTTQQIYRAAEEAGIPREKVQRAPRGIAREEYERVMDQLNTLRKRFGEIVAVGKPKTIPTGRPPTPTVTPISEAPPTTAAQYRAERLVEGVGQRIIEAKDYYAALGLTRTAKPEEIRDTILLYLSTYHPDVYKKAEAEAITRKLLEIRDTLMNPANRSIYDQRLGVPAPPTVQVQVGRPVVYCIKPETLILGYNKPIMKYSVGDLCLGMNGLSNVLQTFNRPYSGMMIRIKAMGLLPFLTTPEHPIFVINGRKKHELTTGERQWKPAKDLVIKEGGYNTEGDYLILPKIKGVMTPENVRLFMQPKETPIFSIPINQETAWLFGLYVAEGSTCSRSMTATNWSLGHHEKDLIQRTTETLSKYGLQPSSTVTQTTTRVHSLSAPLKVVMDESFGVGAHNKKIPDFILLHNDEDILRAFAQGFIDGDGYNQPARPKHHINPTTRFTTVSKTLALQIQLLLARIGKFVTLKQLYPDGREHHIEGRLIRSTGSFAGNFVTNEYSKRSRVMYRITDDAIITPIREISYQKHDGFVSNIQTGDSTYLVSNAVVHNCSECQKEGRLVMMEYEKTLGPYEGTGRSYDIYKCPDPTCGKERVANFWRGQFIGFGK